MNTDAVGNTVEIGDAVCILTAGNFVYGHVMSINEEKAEVVPDIGYRTSKKNFRLKSKYNSRLDHMVKFNYNRDSLTDIQDVSKARQE